VWRAHDRLSQATQTAWEGSRNIIRSPQVRDRPLKALEIPPELVLGNACSLALLGERLLALEDRA
jgi:hypothetical protein